MKRGFFFLWSVIVILPCLAMGAESPWEKKLPFESATITYELSGMETGEEILYIRNFGRDTARYRTTRTSMLGMTMNNRSVEIMTPDWIYHFDLEKKSGSKSINPQKLMIEEFNRLTSAEQREVLKNGEEMGTGFTSTMQGSFEKNAREILGYPCDKVSVMGSTTYSIHGTAIVLHSETNIMGVSAKSIANRIDKAEVPEKYFSFPEGIVPQPDHQADQMAKVMAEQSIAMLKDPTEYRENAQNNMMKMVPGRTEVISPEEQKQVEEAMKTLKELFGN